ncbi:MAG: ubiquinol-cytochrome c reductase iron-sulfur subunit [Nevskiaceae bacterium]|nr:MAG: ubiquinol-cytochrome c reductase iron-sulfur subunit [Nevskiaceae bacterium]TBR73648.1 MAG: ubiquinol-cytochrome c reductase iron-sulfur subunit [Nevskiaceae bacterium]
MSDSTVDPRRRRFLVASASVVGAGGCVAALWPFLASLSPSAQALALGAPVEADISKVAPGQQVTFVWRNQPVWVLNRTPKMLETLPKWDPRLSDPECKQNQQPAYCQNEHRSIKPQYLVMIGICTHLGCSPHLKAKFPDPTVQENWLGGYLCACHGSKYDLSGRVEKDQPAPLNMVVPPYRYKSDTVIQIGVDPSAEELKNLNAHAA